jgi:hypothetical protein
MFPRCRIIALAALFVSLVTNLAFGQVVDFWDTTTFKPIPVKIFSPAELQTTTAAVAVTRLPNQKLALLAKDSTGVLTPCLVQGLQTSWWDTRMDTTSTNWDNVFAAYKSSGANTMAITIHWWDVEKTEGNYTFNFTDMIVAKAKQYKIKVWWDLFTHRQMDMPVIPLTFWVYHLDDRDGKNYSIQWGISNGDTINSITKYQALGLSDWEVYPCYFHPVVYQHLTAMLTALGARYKDSPEVIVMQMGNEEGIDNWLPGADVNPNTVQLFNIWMTKPHITQPTNWSGQSDQCKFNVEIIKLLYQRLTSAYHTGDPYKPTSFSVVGGSTDWGGTQSQICKEGTDPLTYGQGNIDSWGTMIYGTGGSGAFASMDKYYNWATKLPLLLPSELGWGGTKDINTQTYIINTLERGGVGYDIYSNSGLRTTANADFLKKLTAMVNACQDILWGGLPVTPYNSFSPVATSENLMVTTTTTNVKISCLSKDANGIVGIAYFPQTYTTTPAEATTNVAVQMTAKRADVYTVSTYLDGALTSTKKDTLAANQTVNWTLSMSNYQAAFIRVIGTSPVSATDPSVSLSRGSSVVFLGRRITIPEGLTVKDLSIKVFNLNGRFVQRTNPQNSTQSVPSIGIESLKINPGVYVVKLVSNGTTLTEQKIIISK